MQKQPVKAIKFVTICLLPPRKGVVLTHLGIPIAPGERSQPSTKIIRKADVDVSLRACIVISCIPDEITPCQLLDMLNG